MMVRGEFNFARDHAWVWPWPLALLAIFVGLLLLGWIHGLLITRVKLQPFIVTLCGLLIYRGAARYVADDQSRGRGLIDYGFLEKLSTGSFIKFGKFEVPNQFLLLLIVSAIMYVVLHRSVYGRYLYAVGRNEEAARYSGLNTKRIIVSAYVLCLLLTGISGVLLVFYLPSVQASSFGNSYELYAIAAAVLGGCSLRGGEGSILGIVLGTILLQVLQNLVNILNIPTSLNFAVMGTVILIGVTVDQLLGSRKKKAIVIPTAPSTLAVPVASDKKP
jgi:ribose transport system permease protein